MPPPVSPDGRRVAELLDNWLAARLAPDAGGWLRGAVAKVEAGDRQPLFLGFGLTPRKTGKADLALTADELAAATAARPGWDPSRWSVDQAARVRLVLALPPAARDRFVTTLDQLFAAGAVDELVALYQALPVYPHPEAHPPRAAEGVRSNIKAVFTAVAHRNPYPAEQLGEGPWNQLVLKCLFVGVPLAPVVGLDERANPPLMRMLCDFAHERWAAKRPVSPELWRPVGPFADDRAVEDLRTVLAAGSEVEKQAATLALLACPNPKAKAVLTGAPALRDRALAGEFTWTTVAG